MSVPNYSKPSVTFLTRNRQTGWEELEFDIFSVDSPVKHRSLICEEWGFGIGNMGFLERFRRLLVKNGSDFEGILLRYVGFNKEDTSLANARGVTLVDHKLFGSNVLGVNLRWQEFHKERPIRALDVHTPISLKSIARIGRSLPRLKELPPEELTEELFSTEPHKLDVSTFAELLELRSRALVPFLTAPEREAKNFIQDYSMGPYRMLHENSPEGCIGELIPITIDTEAQTVSSVRGVFTEGSRVATKQREDIFPWVGPFYAMQQTMRETALDI